MQPLVVVRHRHAGVEAHAVNLPAARYGDSVAERDDVKRRCFDAKRVASRRKEVLAPSMKVMARTTAGGRLIRAEKE